MDDESIAFSDKASAILDASDQNAEDGGLIEIIQTQKTVINQKKPTRKWEKRWVRVPNVLSLS
jgi:hypothetical protein